MIECFVLCAFIGILIAVVLIVVKWSVNEIQDAPTAPPQQAKDPTEWRDE